MKDLTLKGVFDFPTGRIYGYLGFDLKTDKKYFFLKCTEVQNLHPQTLSKRS